MNITANLFIQHGLYYVILSYRNSNNKRKQKWISTGLSEKGNKRKAEEKYFEVYLNEWFESYKHRIEENTYNSYKTVVTKTTEFFKRKKY